MRALLLTVLTVLTLQSAVPAAEAAPAEDGWTLPQLTVVDRTIKDVDGRTVLLRGANVNYLNDYASNGTGLPTVVPADRTDFERMAALGFDVVRLNIAWSALEPTPGAFDTAYVDRIRQAVQGHLVQTWARLAAVFKDEPAVVGYDLLNEPNPGLRDPFTAADQIGRFYQRAIASIRQAEAGGFQHLVFFEPSALWSALGFDALPPRHYLADPLVVFSPHLYSQSINVSSEFPSIEDGFRIAARAAEWYGAPLWTGEWGWFGEPDDQAGDVGRFVDAMNTHRIGGTWWSWTQACGDPHAVKDGNTGKPQGNLNRIACPAGEPRELVEGFAEQLARAYPRAVPGLTEVTSRGFSGTGSGRVEAWYPGAEQPRLATANLADVELHHMDGGWRLTAHADGDYSVALA